MIDHDYLALRLANEYDGPLAFGYGRVSHADQEDGDSVTAQGDRTRRYYELAVRDLGVPWGRFFGEEKHVSASKRPFAHRPAGKLAVKYLRPGDHLIFDKIDRGWRSSEDFVVTRAWFERTGIVPHVAYCMGASFEWGSPMGKLILTMMVGFAQFEADSTGDRIVRANRHKRERKAFNPGQVPLGCKRVLVEKAFGANRYALAWDDVGMALANRVLALVELQQLSFEKVADILNAEAHEGPRPWSRSAFNKDFWTKQKIHRLHRRALQLKEFYPDTDPNTIEWRKLDRTDKPKSMVAKELLG